MHRSAFPVKLQRRFEMAAKSEGGASKELGHRSCSAYAAGLLYNSSSSLILTGATKGWDVAFPDDTPGDDYDGIIIEPDPSTGRSFDESFLSCGITARS